MFQFNLPKDSLLEGDEASPPVYSSTMSIPECFSAKIYIEKTELSREIFIMNI